MDNKNVFIAIALSMSVLLFWAAFFESPKPVKNNIDEQQKKTNENVITPNINESLKINLVSREDSLENSERVLTVTSLLILATTIEPNFGSIDLLTPIRSSS